MKFIKVTNISTQVNRLSLEKLGLSTKREDVETIGQFGTGVKFAPIAAIRKGLRWVFTGEDAKGSYVLEYVVKDDEGIPCVFYQYEDYEKPSSFTADAGVLSWEEPFQIIREVVANAIDQAKLTETKWSMEIVDVEKIQAVDGEFSVYITADESLVDIIDNFDKYFSVNRTPIYDCPGHYSGFKIFKPIDDYLRIYSKGVLVYSTERDFSDPSSPGKSGLYDYEFSSIALNEERTVKSIYDVNYKIIDALTKVEDNKIVTSLLSNILSIESNSKYEFNSISEYNHRSVKNENTAKIWSNLFKSLYPNHIIIDEPSANINAIATIKAKKYIPIIIDNNKKYEFLSSKEIPTAKDTLDDSFKYSYDMNVENYPNLMEALNIVLDVFEDAKEAYPKQLGVLTSEEDLLGVTLNYHKEKSEKLVLINIKHIEESDLVDIVATLIHELDHFITGADDGDLIGRYFRSIADKRMAELAIQMFKIKNKLEIM